MSLQPSRMELRFLAEARGTAKAAAGSIGWGLMVFGEMPMLMDGDWWADLLVSQEHAEDADLDSLTVVSIGHVEEVMTAIYLHVWVSIGTLRIVL